MYLTGGRRRRFPVVMLWLESRPHSMVFVKRMLLQASLAALSSHPSYIYLISSSCLSFRGIVDVHCFLFQMYGFASF